MTAANVNVSLTEEQADKVREALMLINRLLPQIDDLEACGIDCQQRRYMIEEERNFLQEILNRFGNKQ